MYPQYPNYGSQEECQQVPLTFPPQQQDRQPALEYLMKPQPIFDNLDYQGSGKLKGKTAIITGGDSGIGRAVAVAFAKEGANVAILYLSEQRDALTTQHWVNQYGGQCLPLECDLRKEESIYQTVQRVIDTFSAIHILVNNCGTGFTQPSLADITNEQLLDTFATNFFAYFHMTKAVLPYLKAGDSIINTTSSVAYTGHGELIDYAASKGAVVAFTRSLALSLACKGIRVNGVAPGTIWTPLRVSGGDAAYASKVGADTPMGRAGQPFELAPAYVYLAGDDSRYVSGQMIHINGGMITQS